MSRPYSIKCLSQTFFSDYGSSEYPEIEHKPNRPYIVLTVRIGDNYFAIPFRTTMPHKNGYLFENTGRKTNGQSGVDFSKAVIVNNDAYLGADAKIDEIEYRELSRKYKFIIQKFETYVQNYIKVATGAIVDTYVAKRYQYCTLQYFHKELGIA